MRDAMIENAIDCLMYGYGKTSWQKFNADQLKQFSDMEIEVMWEAALDKASVF